MIEIQNSKELLQVTGEIVSAFLKNNTVSIDEIPHIVTRVFYSLQDVNRQSGTFRKAGPLVPAVAIEDSVHEDYIICLEDGKNYKC